MQGAAKRTDGGGEMEIDMNSWDLMGIRLFFL